MIASKHIVGECYKLRSSFPIAGCNPVAIVKWGGGKWFDSIGLHQFISRSTFGEVNRLSTCVGGFDPRTRYQYAVVVIWVMAADCLSELGGFDSLRRRQNK